MAAATVAIFALLVAPAVAGNGKGGGKGRGGGGQEVAAAPSITLNEADPSFGDVVTFTVVYTPMRDPALVRIWCRQGGTDVYHVAGVATDPFPLGGAQWTEGGAECSADLYYYEWHGITQLGPYYLAATSFVVAA